MDGVIMAGGMYILCPWKHTVITSSDQFPEKAKIQIINTHSFIVTYKQHI
jgi:hypothetical protein